MKILVAALVGLLPAWDFLAGPQSEADKAIKEFKDAYKKAGQDSRARAAAVAEVGKVPDPKTLQVLAQVLQGAGGGQETAEVRIAAADAIGAAFQKVPGAWSPLAQTAMLRDKKITDVRVAATKAVGTVKQKEGLRTLQALCDDKPFEVAREAIDGMALIPDRSSVPLLIKLLREVERLPDDAILPELPFHGIGARGGIIVDDARNEQRQRHDMLLNTVLATLRKLTEQNLRSYDEYRKWWASAGSSFKVAGGDK